MTVGCGNAYLAACKALTVVDANALASNRVLKTLLPPGARGSFSQGGCVQGTAPKRAWTEKDSCIKENRAAGGRKMRSLLRLSIVGGVAPSAGVKCAENARGI